MNRLMEILIFLLLGVIFVSALLGIKEAKPVQYKDVSHQIESEAMIQ